MHCLSKGWFWNALRRSSIPHRFISRGHQDRWYSSSYILVIESMFFIHLLNFSLWFRWLNIMLYFLRSCIQSSVALSSVLDAFFYYPTGTKKGDATMRSSVDFEIIGLTVWILTTPFVSANTAITKRRLCIEYGIPDYRPSDAPLSNFNRTGTRTLCIKQCVTSIAGPSIITTNRLPVSCCQMLAVWLWAVTLDTCMYTFMNVVWCPSGNPVDLVIKDGGGWRQARRKLETMWSNCLVCTPAMSADTSTKASTYSDGTDLPINSSEQSRLKMEWWNVGLNLANSWHLTMLLITAGWLLLQETLSRTLPQRYRHCSMTPLNTSPGNTTLT